MSLNRCPGYLVRPFSKEAVRQLRQSHPEVDLAYDLVQQFAQMLRRCTGEQLDVWLEKVRASHIREFQSFVLGIERDKAAVTAGLASPSCASAFSTPCKTKGIL
jgi:transposase